MKKEKFALPRRGSRVRIPSRALGEEPENKGFPRDSGTLFHCLYSALSNGFSNEL